MNKKKLIYTSYSPNTRKKDLRLNLQLFFQPLKWKKGDAELGIKEFFKKYYPSSSVYVYNYARSAMYHFFAKQKIHDGDEIIYQGYTCSAAILPAVWAGLKPVYCDIDENTLCLDLSKLKQLVTNKTKYIVAQHTLGLSPDIESIRKLADENKIILIEDCTHYLPSFKDSLYGNFGDVSIFSFGRDKVVSGVDGGVLLVNNSVLEDELKADHNNLHYPNGKWTMQRVMFPIIWWYVKKYYFSKFGKLIHLISMKLGILTKATSVEEKNGKKPDFIPAKLPNALATLALEQLDDIDNLQEHRSKIFDIYTKKVEGIEGESFKGFTHIPLRYPMLVNGRDKLLKHCYEQGVNLGNWYSQPISPMDVDQSVLGYVIGTCPVAERISERIVNLPTHVNIEEEDCDKIVDTIKKAQS